MATVWIYRRDWEEGTLPPLCLRCGRPTALFVEKDFFGTLLWSRAGTFFHVLLGGWEQAIARVPLCPRHRHHWRNRRLILLPFFLFSLAVMFGSVACAWVYGEIGSRLLLGNWLQRIYFVGIASFLVSMAFGLSGIQAIDVHDRGIRLACVSDEFARAYEARTTQRSIEAEGPLAEPLVTQPDGGAVSGRIVQWPRP